jgi:hypothetical protein
MVPAKTYPAEAVGITIGLLPSSEVNMLFVPLVQGNTFQGRLEKKSKKGLPGATQVDLGYDWQPG